MKNEDLYNAALQKVRKKKKFRFHFSLWVIFSVFFIILNIATTNTFWAIYPILVWGLAVAIHALSVYSSIYEDDWERKQIEQELKRMKEYQKNFGYIEDDDFV